MDWEITPVELRTRLDQGDALVLVDVREAEELQIAQMGAIHIPLTDLVMRQSELDPEKETVLICHHGIRSAQAGVLLMQLGFEKVKNLKGGIDRWSLEVDSKVPRY
jgi:rhodanese-related sulfurtransferase